MALAFADLRHSVGSAKKPPARLLLPGRALPVGAATGEAAAAKAVVEGVGMGRGRPAVAGRAGCGAAAGAAVVWRRALASRWLRSFSLRIVWSCEGGGVSSHWVGGFWGSLLWGVFASGGHGCAVWRHPLQLTGGRAALGAALWPQMRTVHDQARRYTVLRSSKPHARTHTHGLRGDGTRGAHGTKPDACTSILAPRVSRAAPLHARWDRPRGRSTA